MICTVLIKYLPKSIYMCNKNCDSDINLILNNRHVFELLHKKKGGSLYKYDENNLIIVPTTINICLTTSKYNFDIIKYAKYIIDVLNDGFSGKIKSKYKNNNNRIITEDTKNIIYDVKYFKSILDDTYTDVEKEEYANTIYNYINNENDTRIRFYLDSIEYFDKNFEVEFKDSSTSLLISNFYKKGFYINKLNKKNLIINIIKFTCMTLGVSLFPWMNYITNDIPNLMMVFIDYRTIHKDISNITNKPYNECKTVIHEVGHVFGLRHIFNNNDDNYKIYSILFGKIIFENEFLKKINENNYKNSKEQLNIFAIDEDDINFVKSKIITDDKQIYFDIPHQINPTCYNPIETKKIPMHDNQIVNFCCFMDYSPDEVLTHFTKSQQLIMHYIIRIFKLYLIKNSENLINMLNNNTVKLYLPKKYICVYEDDRVIFTYNKNSNQKNNYKIVYKVNYNNEERTLNIGKKYKYKIIDDNFSNISNEMLNKLNKIIDNF